MHTALDSRHSDAPDFGFQIAPMVDVVFVLLLFFMALSGQLQIERHLRADLPGPGIGTKVPIIIDIDSAGRVYLGGRLRDEGHADAALPVLTDDLHNAMRTSNDPVVIRPAPDVEQADVIHVLSCCKKAGVPSISFR